MGFKISTISSANIKANRWIRFHDKKRQELPLIRESFVFDKVMESVRAINLKGGIFGGTAKVAMVLCIAVTVIIVKIDGWQIALVLGLPMMGIVFYLIKRVLDFAEKNPQAAIMDGSELLVYERMTQGMKGVEVIEGVESTVDHIPQTFNKAEILQGESGKKQLPSPKDVESGGDEEK